MPGTVFHIWLSGAHFVFKWYHQWSFLVLRNGNGMSRFWNSREGVTQGDPLEMIIYGIGILLLIKNLRWELPDVTQTWYADNARELGSSTIIRLILIC